MRPWILHTPTVQGVGPHSPSAAAAARSLHIRSGSMAAGLVLLVDDYEDALDIYRAYLAHRGYQVLVARNGREAVDMARAHRPDLILLDLRMPVLSGIQVVQILRADAAFRDCPIVALTAHALHSERAEAMRAGFNEVIVKPCLPDELASAVDRLLGNDPTGPQVLVVSDLDDQRCAYTAALAAEGFDVRLARSGQEAIGIAQRLRPACTLIDLRLPDTSGWEVCSQLKGQPGNANMRVIVLTQELTQDAAHGSVKVGCHAWLMQPTVASDIVNAVREVLDGERDRPLSPADALLGSVSCPACLSPDVRAGIRVASVQYYCCQGCRLCWRVEAAAAI
jgi:CheY-like chemotaxis protein